MTGSPVARRPSGAAAVMVCVGGALTVMLTAGSATAMTAGPRPEVSDQTLAEAVLDLSSDTAVVDLVVTSERTDGSVTDSVKAGRRTVTLAADVLFAFGSAELTGQAAGRLAEAAAAARGGGPVAVTGYTDAVGDDASNLALSERRAAAVRDALAPQLPGVDLTVIGRGEADPVAPNTRPDGSDNPAGRAANRRVTLTTTR